MQVALLLLMLCADSLLVPELRLSFETSVVANDAKEANGGEQDWGNGFVEVGAACSAGSGPLVVGIDISYAPVGVLDLSNPDRQNQHWLRGENYLDRPEFLGTISPSWDLGFGHRVGLTGGADLWAGLDPIAIGSRHYLAGPATLLHARHYDTGFAIGYNYEDALRVDVGAVDGDWRLGEPDVFHTPSGAANSSPSVVGAFAGGSDSVRFTLSGVFGNRGSYPGDKRRNTSATFGVDVAPWWWLRARPHFVYIEHNPAGDGNGSHIRAVTTTGGGAEFVGILGYGWSIFAHVWSMKSRDGKQDGDIWLGASTDAWGWSIGSRYDYFELLGAFVSVQVGQIDAEGMPLLIDNPVLVALFTLGARL